MVGDVRREDELLAPGESLDALLSCREPLAHEAPELRFAEQRDAMPPLAKAHDSALAPGVTRARRSDGFMGRLPVQQRLAARRAAGFHTLRTTWGWGLSLRPREELVERRAQGLPPLGQVVLDLRRHLGVDDARDDAVALELPKLLDQHLLRDGRNRALEIREAQLPAAEEMEQDHELPSTFQHPDRVLDPDGRRRGCVLMLTHGSSSLLCRAFLRFRRVLPTVIFMTTKTAEPLDLPAPVAAYFAADTTGAEAVAQCFTDGAVVIDERQENRGRTAIARWKAEASSKFRYTVDRLGAHVSGSQTTVTGRVTGDFPGSPVDLQYRFTLEGDKIARLEIAP